MSKYMLERSGAAPLTFEGHELAHVTGDTTRRRWFELAIYRTTAGSYVLSISFRTRWSEEHDHDMACSYAERSSLPQALAEYDPTRYVMGFPDSERYADKQRRLLADVRARYQALVSAVLRQAGIGESVE